jgi:tripartite-type tricarboxylate transporter receptor subunit TctC
MVVNQFQRERCHESGADVSGNIVYHRGFRLGSPCAIARLAAKAGKNHRALCGGGNTDIIARVIAQRLGEAFGQQFVVENRPSASGAVGAEAVARSPADGYTLLVAALSQIAIVPAMMKTSYDPVKSFAPISNIGTNPFVLAVHPSIPANTVGEFVAYARSQPDKLAYVSTGPGTMVHLSTLLFSERARLQMIPVSYKGGGAAPLTDLIAGHVKIYFANSSVVAPYATGGALRLLAISSEKRAPQIPDVPTFIESGFPGFTALTWNGLFAPAGTSKEITDRIAKEVARAVKDPSLSERLASNGVDPLGNSPEEFATMIAADIALWGEAVKIAGVEEK